MKRWIQTPGVIGLELGRRTVKAAQLTRRGSRWSAHALAVFARRQPDAPVSPAEAVYIADVLRRRGFRGRRVALIAPQDTVVSALLELPPENASVSRERVVRMEVARSQRVTPEGLTCCWTQLPAGEQGGAGTQALCWGLLHEKFKPLLDGLEHAGLEPVCVEPAAVALHRGCRPMLSDPSRVSAIADLGVGGVRLVLMHGGRVVHERLLPECGTNALVQALVEKLQTHTGLAERAMQRYGVEKPTVNSALAIETSATLNTLLDNMIEQVSLSFSFVSHQYPRAELGPLLLTGSPASMPGLASVLAEGLELQVVPITPGVLIDAAGSTDAALDAALVSAVGLAMGEGGSDGWE